MSVIRSFKCKETEKIWDGLRFHKLPNEIQGKALIKLRQIDASNILDDLRIPPGNHLESLKGDRENQMSIRINNQWRICFRWQLGEAEDVEIVDYH
jgi:proteic killer suppression protein